MGEDVERNGGPELPSGSESLALLRFPPGATEKLHYYVYALCDPIEMDRIFYIGKGHRDRVFQHAIRAKRVAGESPDSLRLDRIRRIHAAGMEVGIELVRYGLEDERAAFAVEAAVIDALRIDGNPLTGNLVHGHGSVDVGDGFGHNRQPLFDVLATLAARDVTIPSDLDVLLIRLRRSQWLDRDRDVYEKTRKWWRVGERRERAQWAFTVYDGIVRAVFRIDGWEKPKRADLKGNPQRRGRWAFIGARDTTMEERFEFADVHRYFGSVGSQNPVKYVNC